MNKDKSLASAIFRKALLVIAVSIGMQGVNAQEGSDYSEIRKNMDAFSTVLRESLGLNGRAGSFNPFANMSNSYYLAGQGAVIELSTPLARTRASIGMQSIGMTLQQLAEGFSNSNAKSVGARRQYMQELRDSMSLSAQAESAPEKYREIVRQVIEIDFPTEVDKAIRSARESLRNLQGSASLDAETLAEIDAQMNGLGDELANSVDALQSMRSEMTTALREAHIDREELAEQWQESLDELLARVEPIRDSALERAQQLSAMRDQENALRQEQWQVELAQFEGALHESVCEYSIVLRDLPDGEHLSLILKGLGNRESGSSEDRVIVFSKADLLRCQSGDISAQQLQQLAERYSF
jgi:hypothetical protein